MKPLVPALIVGVSVPVALLAVRPDAVPEGPIVKLVVKRASAVNGDQGTGFFSDDHGQVITVYHVVEGADTITVVSSGRLGTVTDVQVERIAPAFDLAVLRVKHPIDKTPSLPIDYSSSLSGDLELAGFPRNGMLGRFQGRSTSPEFIHAESIRDRLGGRLFQHPLDVIQLDLSIYSGLSGGPVVGSRGVVGVLFGSYEEGGGIGWAIPTKYLHQIGWTHVNAAPGDVRWPPLGLLARPWSNLRSAVVVNPDAAEIFERFMGESAGMAAILDGMQRSAYATQLAFMALRPFYQQLLGDRTLQNDPAAARQLLEPLERKAFGSFKVFLDDSDQFARHGRTLSVALTSTITWITREGGLDARQGQSLAGEMRGIRRDLSGMTKGIDAYLGIDTRPLLASMPTFTREMQTAGNDFVAQARARAKLVATWTPAIDRYASPDALLFMSRTMSALRRLGSVMEPYVYRER